MACSAWRKSKLATILISCLLSFSVASGLDFGISLEGGDGSIGVEDSFDADDSISITGNSALYPLEMQSDVSRTISGTGSVEATQTYTGSNYRVVDKTSIVDAKFVSKSSKVSQTPNSIEVSDKLKADAAAAGFYLGGAFGDPEGTFQLAMVEDGSLKSSYCLGYDEDIQSRQSTYAQGTNPLAFGGAGRTKFYRDPRIFIVEGALAGLGVDGVGAIQGDLNAKTSLADPMFSRAEGSNLMASTPNSAFTVAGAGNLYADLNKMQIDAAGALSAGGVLGGIFVGSIGAGASRAADFKGMDWSKVNTRSMIDIVSIGETAFEAAGSGKVIVDIPQGTISGRGAVIGSAGSGKGEVSGSMISETTGDGSSAFGYDVEGRGDDFAAAGAAAGEGSFDWLESKLAADLALLGMGGMGTNSRFSGKAIVAETAFGKSLAAGSGLAAGSDEIAAVVTGAGHVTYEPDIAAGSGTFAGGLAEGMAEVAVETIGSETDGTISTSDAVEISASGEDMSLAGAVAGDVVLIPAELEAVGALSWTMAGQNGAVSSALLGAEMKGTDASSFGVDLKSAGDNNGYIGAGAGKLRRDLSTSDTEVYGAVIESGYNENGEASAGVVASEKNELASKAVGWDLTADGDKVFTLSQAMDEEGKSSWSQTVARYGSVESNEFAELGTDVVTAHETSASGEEVRATTSASLATGHASIADIVVSQGSFEGYQESVAYDGVRSFQEGTAEGELVSAFNRARDASGNEVMVTADAENGFIETRSQSVALDGASASQTTIGDGEQIVISAKAVDSSPNEARAEAGAENGRVETVMDCVSDGNVVTAAQDTFSEGERLWASGSAEDGSGNKAGTGAVVELGSLEASGASMAGASAESRMQTVGKGSQVVATSMAQDSLGNEAETEGTVVEGELMSNAYGIGQEAEAGQSIHAEGAGASITGRATDKDENTATVSAMVENGVLTSTVTASAKDGAKAFQETVATGDNAEASAEAEDEDGNTAGTSIEVDEGTLETTMGAESKDGASAFQDSSASGEEISASSDAEDSGGSTAHTEVNVDVGELETKQSSESKDGDKTMASQNSVARGELIMASSTILDQYFNAAAMQDVVVEGTIETEHEVKAEGILSGITAEQATKAEGLFALAATGGLCIPLGTMAGTEANVVGIPGFWEGSLKTEQKVEISFVQAKVESKVETDAINAETTTFAAAPPTLTVISNAAAIGTMEVEASGYATNLLGVSHMEADKKSNALYTITAAFAMCPPAFAFDYSEDAETGAEADAIASYPDPVAEVDID